jgi:hypothetical protein
VRPALIALLILGAACDSEIDVTVQLFYSSQNCFDCPVDQIPLGLGGTIAIHVIDPANNQPLAARCLPVPPQTIPSLAQVPFLLSESPDAELGGFEENTEIAIEFAVYHDAMFGGECPRIGMAPAIPTAVGMSPPTRLTGDPIMVGLSCPIKPCP